jgi:hypothetical protein
VEVVNEEVEEEEAGTGKGCGCILAVPATLALGILFYQVPDLGVGLVWVAGWGSVIWAAKKVPSAANPAPPPLPERGYEKEQQVSIVRDKDHPNRWLILRTSGWMTEEIDKETGTT